MYEIQQRAASGHTDIYAIIVKNSTLEVWDTVTGGGSFQASPTWTNCDIPLTEHALVKGLYTATFPAAIEAGTYSIFVYKGASPAATDSYVSGWALIWNGSKELTILDTIINAKILLGAKFLVNKTVQNKTTGVITLYDDDGTTPLMTFTPDDGVSDPNLFALTPGTI